MAPQDPPLDRSVEGLGKNKQNFDIDTLLKLRPLEERIYRIRCVEAWSMVIPWVGYSLSEFIQKCEPLPSAKYVQFISLSDPSQMPGLSEANLDWPYSEGLRMDEAMHPLTLSLSGSTGRCFPTRTARPCASSCPGNTASSRRNRSSR